MTLTVARVGDGASWVLVAASLHGAIGCKWTVVTGARGVSTASVNICWTEWDQYSEQQSLWLGPGLGLWLQQSLLQEQRWMLQQ